MLVHWIKDQTESDGVNFRRPWICNSFNTSICVDLISNTAILSGRIYRTHHIKIKKTADKQNVV